MTTTSSSSTQPANGASAHPSAPSFELLPISTIKESPTNPRKTYDEEKLKELAKSIKAYGVLQPVTVRKMGKTGFYELVFGARRLRASRLAGCNDIPTIVRDMTDEHVIEAQIIENCQRDDVHPLEEAEAYRTLIDKHKHKPEEIAAKVGKSLGYVYQRLKLCALVKEGRTAFFEGKITAATALVLARIPHEDLQREALDEIKESAWHHDDESPIPHREAADIVERRYMLRLAAAPFDKGDATLVPAAGACTTCPKRTGNQKELFGDVKSADTCTDPKCFATKRDAAWEAKKREAEQKGLAVLDDKETKKVFTHGDHVGDQADYIDLNEESYRDPKNRTWKTLLGKKSPAAVLARDAKGVVHELVPRSEAMKALKDAGHKVAQELERTDYAAQDKKRRERERAASEKRKEQLSALVAAAQKGDLSEAAWRALVRGIIRRAWHETQKAVAARRGLPLPSGKCPKLVLCEAAGKASVEALRGMAFELVAHSPYHDHANLTEALAAFKVAPAKVAAKKASKKPSKSPKGKKGRAS